MNQFLLNKHSSKNVDAYYLGIRPEMLNFVPEEAKKILDVGCAKGSFGEALKKTRNVEVWGVECYEDAAKVASNKLDKVIPKPFEKNIDVPKHSFDCIVFNDVLEHLIDPYEALLFSKELLNDTGVIVASIPNFRYFGNIWKLLITKDWKYTDDGILDRTHLRFFTKCSIERMFKEQGYQIECLEGINSLDVRQPKHLLKFNSLNFLLLNNIEDMRYFQFAIVARPVSSEFI